MNLRIRTNTGLPLLLVLLAASCQSNKPAVTAGMFSPSTTTGPAAAARDYSKPYLTEDKMQKFLASTKEEHNPLELIFKPGGQMQSPASMGARIDEFNSFARKYGFQDYQDYTAVWGRIVAGQMQIAGQEMFEGMIRGAQAELKKPDLAPEMRKVYEDQIATAQKNIDNMNNNPSRSALNSNDIGLVKKYKAQIEAAQKKYDASR